MVRLRNAFFAGVLILFPLAITVWLLSLLFTPVQRLSAPLAAGLMRAMGLEAWLEAPVGAWVSTILGLLLVAAGICLVGLLGSNILGRRMVTTLDRVALKIPLVKGIYGAARQFLETFQASPREAFRKVVLVEYPRRGCYSIGFLTSRALARVEERLDEELLHVYVPTTPNPTSGYLVILPRDQIVELDLGIEEAVRLVVSGGIVRPGGGEGGPVDPGTPEASPSR